MTPSDAAKDQARSADHVTNADQAKKSNAGYVELHGYLTYHSKDEVRLYQGLGNDEYYAIPDSGVEGVALDVSKENPNPGLAKVRVPSQLRITYVGKGKAKLPAATLAAEFAARNGKRESASSTGPCKPGCGTPGHCYCLAPNCWFDKDDAELKKLGVEILEKPAKS